MPDYAEVWRRLSPSQKRRSVAAFGLCAWGFALVLDMYSLKQRPDFREKFNLPDEEGEEGGAPDKPWKQRKDPAQLEAEIAERTAQLAAAAAGITQPSPQEAPPETQQQRQQQQQQPARSWWSVKLRW